MDAPLVSIIVPAYAHEGFVVACLNSLHEQTYPRLELIFIDDSSPDNTFFLAQEIISTSFAARFENVHLIRKKHNCGAHDSLNIGLRLAAGDYVAIINSDDVFFPNRISILISEMKKSKSEFSFSSVQLLNNNEKDKADRLKIDRSFDNNFFPENLLLLGVRQLLSVARGPTVGFALLRENIAVSTGNFVFSRRISDAVGGFQNMKYCHDWDFILQAMLYTEPLMVPEPLYGYRLHVENSFRGYQRLAAMETEVVLRRFFRSILSKSKLENTICPSPTNWPGYFEIFLSEISAMEYWAGEAGLMQDRKRTVVGNFSRLRPHGISITTPLTKANAFRKIAAQIR